MYVPAVSVAPNGSFIGVVSKLDVEGLYPGRGDVYFSTRPLTEVDTQAAARIAALIASLYAGVDPFSVDWLVSMVSEAPMVGGPSASAATALAMYAVLTGRSVPRNVSLTGMIGIDGSIGPVGGVPEKLEAMARVGVKVFYVPKGEEVVEKVKRVVERHGNMIIERTVSVPVNITELGAKLGVRVVPVASFVELISDVFGVRIPRVHPRLPAELQEYLRSVALRYVSEAEGNLTVAERLYKRLSGSLGAQLSSWVEAKLDTTRSALEEARRALREHLYYIAASRGFFAAINARQVLVLLECVEAHLDGRGGLSDLVSKSVYELLNETKRVLNRVNETLDELVSRRDVNALQIAVGVYERVRLAHEAIASTLAALHQGELLVAVENAVYTYYRARSAEDWASAYSLLGPGPSYDPARLRETVSTFTGFAEMLVAYLEKLGVMNEYLAAARQVLRSLYTAVEMNATYPYRLALAIDAITYSSLAVHRAYGTAEYLYNASRENALYAYHVVAGYGVKPILAASYLEAGDATRDAFVKLEYYERASTILLSLYMLLASRAPGTAAVHEQGAGTASARGGVQSTCTPCTPVTVTRVERVAGGAQQCRAAEGTVLALAAVAVILGVVGFVAGRASRPG